MDEDLNDNDKLRFEYWQAYREYVLSQCKTPFRPQKPQPQNWTNIAIGSSGVHINVLIGRKRSEIAVQLILDSDNAKCNFDKLYNMNFERSKSELSDNIEWARMDDKKSSIITVAIIGDYHNRDDWNRQFEWLYKMSVKFYMFFAPLVKNMK